LKNQLEKGKSKCRVVELALKNFLLTISLYKAYADIINASDSFYFSRKKYDEECDKIYKAINVSVTIGLMTQYEKKLCQENVKYSHKFLERCYNIDDNIVISKDNIEIIKIGYLSSQQISNLEHGHRMKIATRYLTLYDHRDKVMETYRENNCLNDDELYKKCGYKKNAGFEKQHTWKCRINGKITHVSLYAKRTGRAGSENKYEFPPPIDTILYFGSCALVAKVKDYVSLTKDLWKTIYATMFDFENLKDTEEKDAEEDDELNNIDDSLKTKEGYLKDDFVVSDDEILNYDSELSEEEYS
jgi:hypothetical protein